MAKIKGYAGLTMKVEDVSKALLFYTKGLSMPQVGENQVMFPEGMILTVIGGGEYSENKSGYSHICIDTYNVVDGWNNAINDCGAKVSRGNKTPTQDGNLYGGFLRCAGGEEIELWHIVHNDITSEPYDGNLVKAFVHAAVTVPDMDKVIKFYEALGIKEKSNWGWGCSMQLENKHELEVFGEGDGKTNENGIVEVIYAVDDAKEIYEQAINAGAEGLKPYADGKSSVKGLAGEVITFDETAEIKTVFLFGD